MKPLIITLIASLVLLLPSHKALPIEGGAVNTHNYAIKPLKPLSVPDLKPQETVTAVPVASVVATPAPVYTPAPTPSPVTGCGDDQYKAFIYSHESGCNTGSINASSGACGLGQAWPCSKMPCSLSDWACQDNFFSGYALSRYGSWYNAYLYWIAHSNW